MSQKKRWELLHKEKVKSGDEIIQALLNNRGIKSAVQKEEFLNPVDPMNIKLETLGISKLEINKAVTRIKQAKEKGEHVIIYGDYDADGITGTAILWEVLHELGIFVLPHIPERFSEGYGLNLESVAKLKEKDPKLSLIITVDHGIVAGKKISEIEKMGIDVIITDHHLKGKIPPKPLALIYTAEISGSALSWIFSREIVRKFKIPTAKFRIQSRLELAAIGTIADQLPLTGPNRSIAKYGLEELNGTKRPGLKALFEEARIDEIGPYEVGFIIAPRINSMGRLKHGIESLRILCTKDSGKALDLAKNIGATNSERQTMVDEMIIHVREKISKGKIENVIVVADEKYHEGIIGLGAAKLVEEFYHPAIVLSKNGEIAKASARSIAGFNIIEAIRSQEQLFIEGGGHPMAAGFSIETKNIEIFSKEINKYAAPLLTDEVLQRRLKIDCEIDFSQITSNTLNAIKEFEPTGIGNPAPNFVSKKVEVVEIRPVGRGGKHLKMKLKQNEKIFDSIFFGGGEIYPNLKPHSEINTVYMIEENIWNGCKSLQLRVRDLVVLD